MAGLPKQMTAEVRPVFLRKYGSKNLDVTIKYIIGANSILDPYQMETYAMTIWESTLAMAAAGLVGSVVNIILTKTGFDVPWTKTIDGKINIRLGFIGEIIVGVTAAVLFWWLDGPLSDVHILVGENKPTLDSVGLTYSTMALGILIGFGGGKWISNRANQIEIKKLASEAVAKSGDLDLAARLAAI